jgi:transposase
MLRLGRIYPGKTTWDRPTSWLMAQKLEHREQRIALNELPQGMPQESERVARLEQAIREAVPDWSLAEVVTALQAMRGIDLITAVGMLAEIAPRLTRPWGGHEPQISHQLTRILEAGKIAG